jgi:hypothetical protein
VVLGSPATAVGDTVGDGLTVAVGVEVGTVAVGASVAGGGTVSVATS